MMMTCPLQPVQVLAAVSAQECRRLAAVSQQNDVRNLLSVAPGVLQVSGQLAALSRMSWGRRQERLPLSAARRQERLVGSARLQQRLLPRREERPPRAHLVVFHQSRRSRLIFWYQLRESTSSRFSGEHRVDANFAR